MGTVQDIAAFRGGRTKPDGSGGPEADYAYWLPPLGRCPGCNACRSILLAHHDDDNGQPLKVFGRTFPHFECDGKRVLRQNHPALRELRH